MNKEEFMRQIDGCNLPATLDQGLLDKAAAMFGRWGDSMHSDDREHLLETSGILPRKDDSDAMKTQKTALLCVVERIFKMQISKSDAVDIMRNFNRIRGQT